MDIEAASAFILSHTALSKPPLVPELELYLASEITPIWQASEESFEAMNVPPPYWAFAWPGGQALARFLFDHPEWVKGKKVLDFAAGAGLGAIAAAKAGADLVTACDIDFMANIAMAMNAKQNQVSFAMESRDLVGSQASWDLVIAGDVCYEKPMAESVISWLRSLAAEDVVVLLADPGRTYLPKEGLRRLAHYVVPTSLELEDRTERETIIWQVLSRSP